ncbi:MAG: alpha/beta hydrolase [Gammaproteobacteria bacterium]|nr:alpha/beta hydrolase [Gammaproteobacteria bacterium]
MLNRILFSMFKFGFSVFGRIAPRATGRIAFRLFATPVGKRPLSERELVSRKTAALTYLQTPQGSIAIYSWLPEGKSVTSFTPTVLLVHGWTSRATRLGAYIRPLLNKGFRVVSFDAPAHGLSSGSWTTMPAMRAALDAVAENFGKIDAIVAHSFGGAVSAFALQKTDKSAALWETKRLVIISAPDKITDIVAQFGRMLRIPVRALKVMQDKIEHLVGQSIQELTTAKFLARLPTLEKLIIHNREDNEVAFANATAIFQDQQRAKLVVTEGLGHHRIVSDEKVVAAAVEFISNGLPKSGEGAHAT